MAIVVGINAYHGDSAACIVADGVLVAAVEEERFRRIKHWAGFPTLSVEFCLKAANLKVSDIDVLAFNSDPRANIFRKVTHGLGSFGGAKAAVQKLMSPGAKARAIEVAVREELGDQFAGKIMRVEHHLAHLASAHFASPFDDSVVLSVDGLGDFASTAWGMGRGKSLELHGKIHFPHSLGIFYEALTHYLGFKHYGDEYKVMGLAPLGGESLVEKVASLVKLVDGGTFELDLKYFSHQNGGVQHRWSGGVPSSDDCFSPQLEQLLGPARQPGTELTQRHKDIAFATQAVYERAFFHILKGLEDRYSVKNLALAGGCAMNSVANGKIYRKTGFNSVYIAPSAGDAGGAVGAAFSVVDEVGDLASKNQLLMDHAYWGPSFSNEQIKALLNDRKGEFVGEEYAVSMHSEDLEGLTSLVAQKIADGAVVGWFQGRMEWGPRALGNRSILCDPRRADMKEILNLKIKRRESFRPFAPAILRSEVSEWFDEDDDVPFMMQVFQIRQDKRSQIPAVTHLDGSGRLQTVVEETNERYYKLIKAFSKITGVPILLNTSFNENEPVVCTPEEALNTFLRTKMDVLVMGDWLVSRNS